MTGAPLNPFLLARTLGGVVVPGGRSRFGGFGVGSTTASLLAGRPPVLPEVAFSDTDDEVIAKTFERMRDGMAVDRFLADPAVVDSFVSACKRLGIKQPAAAINRRLFRLRKATGGGRLRATSRRDMHRGLVDRLGPAVEFAMVRMAIRHGASTDDLLADPEFGAEFERLARTVIPGGSALEYRLCALQIRKNRHLERRHRSLFESLEPSEVASEFEELGTLADVQIDAAPEEEGIVLLQDPNKPLLLSRFHDLRQGARLLARAPIARGFSAGDHFMDIRPAEVRLRYVSAENLRDISEGSARLWELRLIAELNPTFNWPVRWNRAA